MTRRAAGRRRAGEGRARPEAGRTRGLLETTPAEVLSRAARALEAGVLGLEACARHARDPALRDLADALARDEVLDPRGMGALAKALGVAGPAAPRRSTCGRLRWDWIASSGGLLDGGPDVRLARECSTTLQRAEDAFDGLARLLASGDARDAVLRVKLRIRGACSHLEAAGARARAEQERLRADASS